MATYVWVWAKSEWAWFTATSSGQGGAPGASDSASLGFIPGYPTTFGTNIDASYLDVGSPGTLIGNGTITGDITASTLVADDIVFTGVVTAGTVTDSPGGTVAIAGGSVTASGPVLVGGATLAPTLFEVSGGGVVQANESGSSASIEVGGYGDMEINQGTVTGTLISVTSGTININSGGTLSATDLGSDGTSLEGAGTINVNSGGVMTTGTAALGTSGLAGDTGSVVVNGGTWTNTGTLGVGLGLVGAATGVLSVTGGGSLVVQGGGNALDVGVSNASSGTVSISGSGSTLDVSTGTVTIGNAGTGALAIGSGAGANATDGLVIGGQSGGSGAVSVNGADSTLEDGGALVVGQSGTGGLTVSGGTLDLLSGGITIGASSGAVGNLSMDSASLTVNGTILVGEGGAGAMKLQNLGSGGAVVSATGLVIGDGPNSSGSVTVDGSGTSFDSSGVTVGNADFGGIKISDTAVATTSGDVRSAIGAFPGQDTISVDTGGQWSIAGTLAIGQVGTAAMSVKGGAGASAAEVDLGVGTLGVGMLSMSGGMNLDGTPQDVTMHFGTLLNVGGLGAGTVSLSGNATLAHSGLTGGNIALGESAGSAGTISLSGTNDLLSGNFLSVGGGFASTASTGLLSIASGDRVVATGAYVAATGIVTMSGASLTAPSIGDDGTISGSGTIFGAFGSSAGFVIASGGSLEITGAVGSLTPEFDIGNKSILALDSIVVAGANIVFVGTKAVLVLPDFADYQNTPIQGFGTDSKIILPNVIANKGKVSGNELILEDQVVQGGTTIVTNGTAVVTNGTTVVTVMGSIDFPQMSVLSALGFKVKSGPTVGVGTTISVACYAAGTRLSVPGGETPVETLRAGDLVRTAGARCARSAGSALAPST